MKTLLKTLLISIILVSCSSDDDPFGNPQEKVDTTLISISIPNGHYLDGSINDVKSSGHIYLTDNEGELIIDSELLNNSITELTGDYDVNKEIQATFLWKREYPDFEDNIATIYHLKTFSKVEPYTFEFEEKFKKNPANNEKAKIFINNTNGYLQDFLAYNSYGTKSSINSAELEIDLKQIPDDIYVSFKHENENARRYILMQNIEEDISKSIEYESLPVAKDFITINYPGSDKLHVTIFGAIESNPNNFFARLSEIWSYTGLNSFSHNLPLEPFQNFKVSTSLEIGNEKFSTIERGSSINQNYSKPNLSFQVLDNSFDNYEISSSSMFDYYSVNLYYSNEAKNYDIIWTIYGKSQANIKLTIPQILDFHELNNTTLTIDDFTILSATIIKIDGIDSYKEFINSQIDDNSYIDNKITKYESMRK